MDQAKIGHFLKELRKEKGLTQEQAAEQFNVARRTVSRWETGSNMPDLSMLVELAAFYDVDVREIIEGERKKSEIMNEEMKDTLEKVADYTDALRLKSIRKGVIAMSGMFIVLILISAWKEITAAPLVSMFCAYNGAVSLSNYGQAKDKSDFITGVLFFFAMILNTVAFILS